MIFVLGGTGFIGSAYVRFFKQAGIDHVSITKANYDVLRGQSCDVLINANGNSKKFLAAKDPKFDFDASVVSVAHSIFDFDADLYVYLSSGDVYPDSSSICSTREDQHIDPASLSVYGRHKLFAEKYVEAAATKYLIIRQSGFLGKGLKKNAIFDMANDQTVWLSQDSELQFDSVDGSVKKVNALVQKGFCNDVFNVSAPGRARLGTVHKQLNSASPFKADSPTVSYELNLTKLATALDEDLITTEQLIVDYLATSGSGGEIV